MRTQVNYDLALRKMAWYVHWMGPPIVTRIVEALRADGWSVCRFEMGGRCVFTAKRGGDMQSVDGTPDEDGGFELVFKLAERCKVDLAL